MRVLQVDYRRHRNDCLALFLLLALVVVFYNKIILFGQILVGYDILTYFYPNESYAAEALSQLRLPLWNPYLFTGVPFLANLQTAVFYPFNLLFLVFAIPHAFAYSVALHVFLAGCFMYLFGRVALRLGVTAALIAAVVFAFSGFVSSLVGHINQLHAAVWLPLLLLSFDLSYRRRSVRWALVAGLVLALQLTAGHAQESYLTLFAAGMFLVYRAVVRRVRPHPSPLPVLPSIFFQTREGPEGEGTGRRESLKGAAGKVALWGLALGAGTGLAAVQLVPALELSGLSIRAGGMSYKEAVAFSLPPWLALKSFLPVFADPQPFSEWLAYVGIFAMALAALGIIARWRSPDVVFAVVLCCVALFFAFGQYNPLYPLAYKVVPGLALFRVPARWLYLYTFGVAVLAGVGADYLAWGRGSGGKGHGSRGKGQGSRVRDRGSAELPLQAPAGSESESAERKRVLRRLAMACLGMMVVLGLSWAVLRGRVPVELPSGETRTIWLALGLVAMVVVAGAIATGRGRLVQGVLAVLVAGELFAASQNLEMNHGNIEEAYTNMRPAIAHFVVDKGLYRILPLSENNFDPGDLNEMREVFGKALSPERVYDFVVTVKLKETLMPNLPLLYRLATIDGYDGGMLPLRRYAELKRLFPRERDVAADARLREELATMPDSKLLGWLNVKYVLMDRTRDAWVDGVYYDLALTRSLDANGADLSLRANLPRFEATSIGIVSNLSGAGELADGMTVAWVTAMDVAGVSATIPLRVGLDTSEGRYAQIAGNTPSPHRQAKKAKSWKGEPEAWDYATKLTLPRPMILKEIAVRYVENTGRLNLRGASLVDDRTQASYPVVISDALKLVHVADVKIYENHDALPRAFLAYDKVVVDDDAAALAALRDGAAIANGRVVLFERDIAGVASFVSSPARPDLESKVEILSYEPERVVMTATLDRPGWLVLTDSYYPGWSALVDGSERHIARANYMFRAVQLEPGEHRVEFRYEPDTVGRGVWISVATLIVGIAAFVRFR
ncbi:MAG: YfhO family protein [Chloroflexi bacterium]|nr:YfhO family protein [Chloroflexota bacterium]